jgi:hypothetical protein
MGSQELSALFNEYNQLVTTTLANPAQINTNLPQIQAKNVQIANKLDQLIQDSAMSGSTDPGVENARTELIQKLNRIQRDYNGLIQNTDKLETLRRIKSFKVDSSQSELQLYLFVFLFLGLVVIVVLMFKRQNADTAAAIPNNPTTMAAFT